MTDRPAWNPPIPGWTAALNPGFGLHFRAPIAGWFEEFFDRRSLVVVALRARLEWTPGEASVYELDSQTFTSVLWTTNDNQILVAVDAALYQLAGRESRAVNSLGTLLEAGGSAWRVRDDGCGLERRVPEAIHTAVAGAVSSAKGVSADAAEHLQKAWVALYGIAPDASSAYAEAVRAVESAAGRLVEPNNAKATLGTINGSLRTDRARWRIAITDAQGGPIDGTPVLAMQELLWHGHTDRHGANPTIQVTRDAAQSAVHLAATLVQWWTAGGIVKS
jgi:hypothetical protein